MQTSSVHMYPLCTLSAPSLYSLCTLSLPSLTLQYNIITTLYDSTTQYSVWVLRKTTGHILIPRHPASHSLSLSLSLSLSPNDSESLIPYKGLLLQRAGERERDHPTYPFSLSALYCRLLLSCSSIICYDTSRATTFLHEVAAVARLFSYTKAFR